MSEQLDDDRDFTWRVLREMINAMPEERLDDQVELLPEGEHDEPLALHKVIGLKSILEWSTCHESGEAIENYTRSAVDNKHHPERYALLSDENPFDEDGNFAFECGFIDGRYTGIPTGFVYEDVKVMEPTWHRKRVDQSKEA